MPRFFMLLTLLFGAVTASVMAQVENETVELSATLVGIEDGAYPLVSLVVLPAESDTLYLTMNLENYKGPAVNELHDGRGKKLNIVYEIVLENNALDIYVDGASIMGDDAMPDLTPYQMIEGILFAPEVTESDLPGTFTLELPDGNKLYFPYYITPEMVANHEKTVTVYWMEVENQVVTTVQFAD